MTEEAKERKKRKKVIVAVGKRKRAIAKATIREGSGRVRINSIPLGLVSPRYKQIRVREPLVLAGELAKNVDIDVSVRGGGVWGQADAARTAIANALVQFHKDENLKNMYIEYSRSLLISDPRRTEPHKPSRSTAGPRRTKQQSKR